MQSFRVTKPAIPRSRNSTIRRLNLAAAIELSGNKAMVSCTECARHGVECFYDSERSTRCAECLRKNRNCDGSFSLEEFRKVVDQKKLVEAELLKKRRLIAETRRRLAELEEDGLKTEEWLLHLKEQSDRMLSREMRALGVLDSCSEDQSLALGDQSVFVTPAPDPSQVDLAGFFFSDDPQLFLDVS